MCLSEAREGLLELSRFKTVTALHFGHFTKTLVFKPCTETQHGSEWVSGFPILSASASIASSPQGKVLHPAMTKASQSGHQASRLRDACSITGSPLSCFPHTCHRCRSVRYDAELTAFLSEKVGGRIVPGAVFLPDAGLPSIADNPDPRSAGPRLSG